MKKIFNISFGNGNKYFSITNYKKDWIENGNTKVFGFRTNGAKKKNGDSCLDVHLNIGYTVFNYTNFNLQGLPCNKDKSKTLKRHSNIVT